ncbi:MAG: hypothetical protein AMXMBFR23_17810 [Chloroflexota bacterium]
MPDRRAPRGPRSGPNGRTPLDSPPPALGPAPDTRRPNSAEAVYARSREFERFTDTSGQRLTREEMNER